MTPEDASIKLWDVFEKYYDHKVESCADLVPDLQECRAEIKLLIAHYAMDDDDARTGAETYGFENWKGNLEYISDRWRCRFRLQWLSDLLDHLKEVI